MNQLMWIFQDGAQRIECTSFPFAFRTMWTTVKKETEKGNKGRNYVDMVRGMCIISPMKDRNGELITYCYSEACDMARSQGLLSTDGQINSKEFKRF